MSSADLITVLSLSYSPFCLRVIVALEEKGLQYEYVEEDPHTKSQLLLSSNPIHKKVPVLIHKGKAVCESIIAVQYIDENWPKEGTSFLPKDPYQRAVARFWADYVDKKAYDAGRVIFASPDGELREQAKKDYIDLFIMMDSALRDVAGGKPYFGGDSIGLVDIAYAPFICWFKIFESLGDFKLPDEKQCPHLNAWCKRVVEYPSVKKAMALTPPDLLEIAVTMRKQILEGAALK